MAEKNYAREWYEYGLEHDDPIVKFMLYWVAFNWLYSAYRGTPTPTMAIENNVSSNRGCNRKRNPERDKIKAFCNANYEKLARFDAFDREEAAIFMEQAVRSVINSHHRDDEEHLLNDLRNSENNSEKKIESLLLTIYQVRCNLFHGSKSLEKKRDIDLVRASSVLLEGYLEEVI